MAMTTVPLVRRGRGFKNPILLFVGPAIVFLILANIAPATVAFVDSLTALSLTESSKHGQFIGLDNYRNLLGNDEKFSAAALRTVLFVLIVVPIEFALGLAIALRVNREFRYKRLIITILMLPTMIAPVVVGMMWRYLLMPSFGLLTYYLQQMGFLSETTVFSNPVTAFTALIIIDIWEWTPFMMLIMLAGLTALPQEPVEAAYMDGATPAQMLWHVQLPMLKPLIVIAFMFRSIDASKIFDSIYVLTGGGPGDATESVTTFAYRTTFVRWDLGYGAAICLCLSFFSLLIAAAFYKFVSRSASAGRTVEPK
jgi:multiple sugar transport system permease protein